MTKEESMGIKALILLSLLLLAIAFSGCLKEGKLTVSGMDVAAERVTSASVFLNVTTNVENYQGGDSRNISLLLKALNTESGLLQTQARRHIGTIKRGQTAMVDQAIVLPRKGSYRLEAILFEGSVKIAKGERTIRNLELLPAEVKSVGIEIPEIDFTVRNASGGRVLIQSDIMFTNEGADPSAEYDVLVKAKEMDAGLIAEKRWIRIGRIPPESTVVRSVNLTVPDQYNYLVQVELWSNETVVKRGEGRVLLRPGVRLAEGERVETKTIKTSDFVLEAAPAKAPERGMLAPGFEAVLALLSLAALILARRQHGR